MEDIMVQFFLMPLKSVNKAFSLACLYYFVHGLIIADPNVS